MAKISAKFDDAKVKDFLKQINKNLSGVKSRNKQYTKLVSALVYENIIDHFDKQKGPTSNWQKWSVVYRKYLKRIGKSGNKILQDTGHLRQTFKPTSFRTNSDGILWFNNARTPEGEPYAALHNYGGVNRKGWKIPQRRFMWIDEETLEKIADQTLKFSLNKKD